MDARGNTPRVWHEENEIASLIASSGPFVSLHLATPGDNENASQTNQARWRETRQQLEAQGASEVALKNIDELITDAHLEGNAIYVVADNDSVRHVSYWPHEPTNEMARFGSVASVAELLSLRAQMIPHVKVTADRLGADVDAFQDEDNALHRTVETDDDYPFRKVQGGGWSQRRFQQRAENTWENQAREVADGVIRLVNEVNARVLFVAGDVRAVQLLQSHLPDHMQSLVQHVDGTRAHDGSPAMDEAAVEAHLTQIVASDTAALVEKLREEEGQDDRGVEGAADVLEALAMAQVEVLLVNKPSEDDDRTAWFGPEPAQVALSKEQLEALNVENPQEGRLVDVAIRAALGTSAGAWVLNDQETMRDGLAAILRWK